MELIKRLWMIAAIHCFLIIFMVAGFIFGHLPAIFLITLIVTEILGLILLYYMVLKPLAAFQKILEKEDGSEEILNNASDHIIFIDKIRSIIEKISNQRIRENSAMMFDKQAELTALQSQINPHFLCNTLESIRGQALMDDNNEIAKMVEALASFFRYSISRKGNFVTLRDELANVQNYMMIQRYRFNNRFSLEIMIDEEDEKAYDYLIPKLILQPVVENAIYHGLEEMLEGGKVGIEVIVTESIMILTVSDNGKGMDGNTLSELNKQIHSPEHLQERQQEKKHNTGIALPNIHKRIQLLFGEEYGINVYSTLNQGTDVEITIPADYERNSTKS